MKKVKFMSSKRLSVLLVVILSILLTASFSMSQDFPDKPITIIVPWSAGGGGDAATRILATGMEQYLHVPVVVNNIPGAGSLTGMITLWRSKPDGYTIAMNYAQMVCGGQIFQENVPYDINKFSIIGQFVTVKYSVAVPKGSNFKSIKDFKTVEKPVRFCVVHFSSNEAITALALSKEYGFPLSLVSGYKGAAPSILGAMKGECDAVDFGSALSPYYKKGDMVPILSLTNEPSDDFPNVPSLKELGLPEYLEQISNLNYVLWGPPKMPETAIIKLQEAMIKAANELKDKFRDRLLVTQPLGSGDTKKMVLKVYDNFVKQKEMVEQYKSKN